MTTKTASKENSVNGRLGGKAQGSAAGQEPRRHNERPREAKDRVRANGEKVMRITERALDLTDSKKSR